MKQVFFSVTSVLMFVLISSAVAFNPLTVRAQMEFAPAEAPISQGLNPVPTVNRKELISSIPAIQAPINKTKAFEELHKDKNLIVELDEFEVKVNSDFSYQVRDKKRIKILNDSIIDALGEMPLYYNSSRSKITSLKAHTIAPDGTIYPCSQIQDLNLYKQAIYSDMRVKVVTFSRVTVGSRLEYEVITDHSRGAIEDSFFMDFYLSFRSPVKEQNISFALPKSLNIAYREYNLKFKPNITEDANNIRYSWHLLDMYEEPLREKMLPPSDNLVSDCFQFSSIKSWDDVSAWYYNLVQKNLLITPEIISKAKDLTKDKLGIREKTKAILEYIQKDFRYVFMGFGDNRLEPHKTTEVFNNKYGDCKDLSLLCMAFLKSASIDSSIALFNTESSISDPSKDLPFPTLFDHVLLLVRDPEKGDFFIDPLLNGYDIEEYPLYYQHAYTFVIGENKGEFKRFPIFSRERIYDESDFTVTIEPDGSATSENRAIWGLDFSIKMRNKLKSMNDDEKKHLYEYLDNAVGDGGKVLEREINGLDKGYGPLTSYAKVYNKDEYPVIDNMIIINLVSYQRPDDFTSKERQYPIFNPYNSLEKKTIAYKIPKGFDITYMPKNIYLDNGYFSLRREFKRKKDTITVTATEEYRRKELPVEKYTSLREFCDRLPRKTTQRIVLTRKKSLFKRLFSR